MSAVAAINASAPEVPKDQPPARKRGHRGELGKGTRADRVKAAWRSYKKESKKNTPLRVWARMAIKSITAASRIENTDDGADLAKDIAGWLEVKTHVHTPAVRKAMKEAKSKKRAKPKKPSKDRRRVKGNSGKR